MVRGESEAHHSEHWSVGGKHPRLAQADLIRVISCRVCICREKGVRCFVLFLQFYGHAVSEQAMSCGYVGWRQEEPFCATQGRTFDKNESFEVSIVGRVCTCCGCPSSIRA